ncbi:MAG: hypothetical protein QOF09_1585 [Alphaproteobacteria bacterium]|nr:hypothetical protein [Alphaproteobacteria bacterium]
MRRHFSGTGCGARGRASQARLREASGNRPLQLRGAAFDGWTREGRPRAEARGIRGPKRPPSDPGSTVPGTQNAAVERRKATRPAHGRARRKA